MKAINMFSMQGGKGIMQQAQEHAQACMKYLNKQIEIAVKDYLATIGENPSIEEIRKHGRKYTTTEGTTTIAWRGIPVVTYGRSSIHLFGFKITRHDECIAKAIAREANQELDFQI